MPARGTRCGPTFGASATGPSVCRAYCVFHVRECANERERAGPEPYAIELRWACATRGLDAQCTACGLTGLAGAHRHGALRADRAAHENRRK